MVAVITSRSYVVALHAYSHLLGEMQTRIGAWREVIPIDWILQHCDMSRKLRKFAQIGLKLFPITGYGMRSLSSCEMIARRSGLSSETKLRPCFLHAPDGFLQMQPGKINYNIGWPY